MNSDESKKSPAGKGPAGLLIGILLVVVFLYWLGPQLARLPLFAQVVRVIEAENIDAGAYYYTDIEEFAEAEFNIRQSMTYAPGDAP